MLLLNSFEMLAQNRIRVYQNEQQFCSKEVGNYLETQLNFIGHTINYVNQNGELKGSIEVTQLFFSNDTLIQYDKYILSTPAIVDSLVEDFYDIHRFILDPGLYDYELIIKDLNASTPPISVEKQIIIEDLSEGIKFSSITACESIYLSENEDISIFSKYGYEVIPKLTNYFPDQLNYLPYYTEIYNSKDNNQTFIVEQNIFSNEKTMDLSDYTRYYRFKSADLKTIVKMVDLTNLPTGNYTLSLSLMDSTKNIINQETYIFDRANEDSENNFIIEDAVLDPSFEENIPSDSTGYYLASLIPISGPSEVRNILSILKERDSVKNKKYIQAYWNQTSQFNAFEDYMKYKEQVLKVETLFGTNYQVGFETDRGRVYLQYGQPNQISEQPQSNSEYPYEIWQYDKIGRFSNKRFVFYNPTNITNDFKLLHSNMVGELQNYRWQYALNKRNTSDDNIDNPMGSGFQEHFGRNSSLYYNSY